MKELDLLLDEVDSWKEKLDLLLLIRHGPGRAGATRKHHQPGNSVNVSIPKLLFVCCFPDSK